MPADVATATRAPAYSSPTPYPTRTPKPTHSVRSCRYLADYVMFAVARDKGHLSVDEQMQEVYRLTGREGFSEAYVNELMASCNLELQQR